MRCSTDYRLDRDVLPRANMLPGDERRGDTARGGDRSRKVRRYSRYLPAPQAPSQAFVQIAAGSSAACSAVVPVRPQSRLSAPNLQILRLVANLSFREMRPEEINRAPIPRGSSLSPPSALWRQGL